METNTKINSSFKIIDIVEVGLMAAMVLAVTSLIKVPTYMGVLHIGDSMVFVAAVLLGRKKSLAASAIGMCLFDVLNGYLLWAPFTLVIKGVMAYISAVIAHRSDYNGDSFWNNMLAFTMAGIWMVGAYYIGGAIILSLLSGAENVMMSESLVIALKDIPTNVFQVVLGMAIALPLCKPLKKSLRKVRL